MVADFGIGKALSEGGMIVRALAALGRYDEAPAILATPGR